MKPFLSFASAILVLFFAWLLLVPEPVRTYPAELTSKELKEIRRAIKKHGDYPIVIEPGKMYMITPRGRIKL